MIDVKNMTHSRNYKKKLYHIKIEMFLFDSMTNKSIS